jgi:hypothetical protein
MSKELKPCKKCGNRNFIDINEFCGMYQIQCSECKRGTRKYTSIKAAITAWNKRVKEDCYERL